MVPRLVILTALLTFLWLAPFPCAGEDGVLLDSQGGVDLFLIRLESPNSVSDFVDRIHAAKLVLRTEDPADTIVTFERFGLRGDVHHVWSDLPQFPSTPNVDDVHPSARYHADWGPYDSHVLIPRRHALGTAPLADLDEENAADDGPLRASFQGVDETNDGSTSARPIGLGLPRLEIEIDGIIQAQPPRSGFGDVEMKRFGAFFLSPERQSNEVEFARIATACVSDNVGHREPEISFELGVLGEGIVDSGLPGGAVFNVRVDPALNITCVPEPSSLVLACFGFAFFLRFITESACGDAGFSPPVLQ